MASKIGGCSVSDFFVKLKDLGFEVEKNGQPEKEKAMLEMPDFLKNINPAKIVKLDCSGRDSLRSSSVIAWKFSAAAADESSW